MSVCKKHSVNYVISGKAKEEFTENSVIQIKNLFDKKFCENVQKYIIENEKIIINRFSDDKKGLVLEDNNSEKLIKYFEYPFSFNRILFGKFSESKIYKVAETLLNQNVYIFSMEIHSRIAKGTPIPPHQDNAYYGLKNAKALTFYIPLSSQNPYEGGLRYCSNNINNQYEHKISNEKGFSLTIRAGDIMNKLNKIDPIFEAGDCTVHHSRSVHYADKVPANISRGLVLRMSFFGSEDYQNPEHEKWYNNIVKQNRLANSED